MTSSIVNRAEFAKYVRDKLGKQVDNWVKHSHYTRGQMIPQIWQSLADKFEKDFTPQKVQGNLSQFLISIAFLNIIYVLAVLNNISELAVAKQQKIVEECEKEEKEAAEKKKEAVRKLEVMQAQVAKKRKLESPSTSSAAKSESSPAASSTPKSKNNPTIEDLSFLQDISQLLDDDDDHKSKMMTTDDSSIDLQKQIEPIGNQKSHAEQSETNALMTQNTDIEEKDSSGSSGQSKKNLPPQIVSMTSKPVEELIPSSATVTSPPTNTLPPTFDDQKPPKKKLTRKNIVPSQD